MNEEILVAKAKKGDRMAFEELMDGYFKRIYSIAYRMSGNADDASDMTQEVMLKLYRNIKSFGGKSRFSTWVYRVATNTCLDELKKLRRHTSYSIDSELETSDGSMTVEIEDDSPTPEQKAENSELKALVAKALNKLGDEHRAVLVLRDIQGLSYDEIAKILACSEGTVKSRISRARANLKKILEKDFAFDGTYFKQ